MGAREGASYVSTPKAKFSVAGVSNSYRVDSKKNPEYNQGSLNNRIRRWHHGL